MQLMRFVRRTEGIDSARKIFKEARKAPACTYHVYVASATMELCVDKDPKVTFTHRHDCEMSPCCLGHFQEVRNFEMLCLHYNLHLRTSRSNFFATLGFCILFIM